MASPELDVCEIYLSIQGEGTRAGRRCVFVRLAGCNLRCSYCDTSYAQSDEGADRMPVSDLLDAVAGYQCPLVEVTGGEPLLQAGTVNLLDRLLAAAYEVLLETNGSLDISSVPSGVKRVVDVKTPGSGMAERNLWTNLEWVTGDDEVKFVICDRPDYEWAVNIVREHDLVGRVALLFSPAHGRLEAQRLAEWILDDRLDVRLNLQLHRVIWPDRDRGV